jgi:RNA polymerase sigma factor (sigma-70 family)
MTSQQFFQTYAQYEPDIIKILTGKNIFDEDLLHDTMLALYEYSPHPAPDEFVTTFVSFYRNARRWNDQHESHYEPCDNQQLLAYDRPDNSAHELVSRERQLRRLDKLLDYYFTHPQPGRYDHERSCLILRLFLEGLSEREISDKLNISHQAVHQSLSRTIDRLRDCRRYITI